ncbi:hypothetical protein BBJ28_00002953 [Nothophytophthora sp. Chile5]|nr:hypothetical protein BBJ28_00002953 [Nothophytophthora sp. Chile5]
MPQTAHYRNSLPERVTDGGLESRIKLPRGRSEQFALQELERQAEAGTFSDSESERSSVASENATSSDSSDTESGNGTWMILPSALDPTGHTIRRVTTEVMDGEEQLLLVKRRARAAKALALSGRKTTTTAQGMDDPRQVAADAASPEDFQHIKVIGVGGMGRVVLVRHRLNQKLYAMKVISKRSVRENNLAATILSERDVLGGTHHHALAVHLHWAFQTKSRLYLVMDYCPGGELSMHLERARRFQEDVAVFYAAELVLALEHLHQHGIVHRDLKPENMLLTEDGHLKLVDFGISKFGITEATSGAKTICGSYEYLGKSPEMLEGKEYGTAADWWAFGAVLFEFLTGLPPCYSHNPDEMRLRILHSPVTFPSFLSPAAKDLLGKLLVRNSSERLGSKCGSSEIKEHRFFRDIDWEMLLFRETRAPIQPCATPQTIVDASNFRAEFTRMSVGSMGSSGGGGILSESFKGFNFEAPEAAHIEYGYARDMGLPKSDGGMSA